MKRILIIMISLFLTANAYSQQYNWGFGFFGDLQASSSANHSFGLQSKYDASKHSAIQAQVFGRTNYVGFGADYLYSFLDKTKSDFNVFLGAGVEENLFWSTEDDGILRPELADNYFNASGQVGVNYYFRPVQLSVYAAYKVKYDFKNEHTQPDYISLGVRYHLW